MAAISKQRFTFPFSCVISFCVEIPSLAPFHFPLYFPARPSFPFSLNHFFHLRLLIAKISPVAYSAILNHGSNENYNARVIYYGKLREDIIR